MKYNTYGTQTWCSWASSNCIYQSASWTLFPFYQVYIQSHISCHWNAVNSDKQVYSYIYGWILCVSHYTNTKPYSIKYTSRIHCKNTDCSIHMWLIVIAHWLKILRTSGTESIRKTCGPPPSTKLTMDVRIFITCKLAKLQKLSEIPVGQEQSHRLGKGVPVSKNYVEPVVLFAEPTQPVATTTESDTHIQYIPQPIQHSETRTITPREIDAPSPGVMYFRGVMTELGRRCRVKSNSLMRPTSCLGPFHSAGLTTSFVGRARKLGKDSVIRLQSN